MPTINRICPQCRRPACSTVGEHLDRNQLVWFESFRCSHCGCSMEIDDRGVAEFSVRQAILAETGLWSWRVADAGRPLLEALSRIRQLLKLNLSDLAAIKAKAPGILAAGTRAEMELLARTAAETGLESLVESAPAATEAPLDFSVFSYNYSGQEPANAMLVRRTPVTISPADFIPLERFELVWRWTDPKYALFTPRLLAKIRPLSHAKAFAVWQRSYWFLDDVSFSTLSLRDEFCAETQRLDLTVGEPDAKAWLTERLPDRTEDVFISWEPHTAVVVPIELFVERWDDFCYPGSDDAAIWPASERWFLFHDHEEQFLFGMSRRT